MLLFLPGLICDARTFAPQLAAFRDSRAIDGYGTAGSLDEMARIVLDQAPDSFDLFGHSMGGRIALEVVSIAPHRVRRLALASTGVHPVGTDEPAKRRALQTIGHEQGFAALVDAWLPPMVAEANRARADLMASMREMCLDQGQAVFDAQIAALLGRQDRANLLPQIACPTLVVTGELDTWSPPTQHREIADAIPGSTLAIVEGAGHMLPFEAPEALNSIIAGWLAAEPAGSATS